MLLLSLSHHVLTTSTGTYWIDSSPRPFSRPRRQASTTRTSSRMLMEQTRNTERTWPHIGFRGMAWDGRDGVLQIHRHTTRAHHPLSLPLSLSLSLFLFLSLSLTHTHTFDRGYYQQNVESFTPLYYKPLFTCSPAVLIVVAGPCFRPLPLPLRPPPLSSTVAIGAACLLRASTASLSGSTC